MTAFRILAERIAEGNQDEWKWFKPSEETIYCDEYFRPSLKDFFEWNKSSNRDRNNLRILILLFAEQHYLHYKKIDDENRL